MIRRVAIARFVSPLLRLHPFAPEDAEDDEVDGAEDAKNAAKMNDGHNNLGGITIGSSFASTSCCRRCL